MTDNESWDEHVLAEMAAGNLDALDTLYARHGSVAFSLAARITGNSQTAEEVVQESFFAAWRGAPSYQTQRGSARSWLLGIVHHRAIDVVRARIARPQAAPLDAAKFVAAKDDVWAEVQQTLDRDAIRRALTTLPSEQRQSIELAYFGGLTYPEIAQQLQAPLGTIKSRLRLGLERLRVLLLEPPPSAGLAASEIYAATDGNRSSGAARTNAP